MPSCPTSPITKGIIHKMLSILDNVKVVMHHKAGREVFEQMESKDLNTTGVFRNYYRGKSIYNERVSFDYPLRPKTIDAKLIAIPKEKSWAWKFRDINADDGSAFVTFLPEECTVFKSDTAYCYDEGKYLCTSLISREPWTEIILQNGELREPNVVMECGDIVRVEVGGKVLIEKAVLLHISASLGDSWRFKDRFTNRLVYVNEPCTIYKNL